MPRSPFPLIAIAAGDVQPWRLRHGRRGQGSGGFGGGNVCVPPTADPETLVVRGNLAAARGAESVRRDDRSRGART
jgi:hypothetical protein